MPLILFMILSESPSLGIFQTKVAVRPHAASLQKQEDLSVIHVYWWFLEKIAMCQLRGIFDIEKKC